MATLDTRPRVAEAPSLHATRPATPVTAQRGHSELRWTAGMLWIIGLLPSMGLGLLLFDTWLAPVPAGALGVVLLSLVVVPASKLAIAHVARRNRRSTRR